MNVPNLSLSSGLSVSNAYAVISGFAKSNDSSIRVMVAFYVSKSTMADHAPAIDNRDYELPISSPASALQSLVVNGNISLLDTMYSNLQTLPDFANSTLV